jgi:hypothetical protein
MPEPLAQPADDAGEIRDPEDRVAEDEEEVKDKMLDKTIADSFPASDPPSTIPDPEEDSFAVHVA